MTYTDAHGRPVRQRPQAEALYTPYGTAEVVALSPTRVAVTGTTGDIAALIGEYRAHGRLVGFTEPVTTGVPGQFLVNVRLAPEPVVRQQAYTMAPERKRMSRGVMWGLIGGVVVLGLLAWGVVVAVNAIAANPYPVIGVLGVVAIAIVIVGSIGGRGGGGGGGKTFSGTFQGRIK